MKMRKFEKGGFATSEDSDYNRDSLGDFIVKKDVDKPLPVDTVADDEAVVTDNVRARTSPAVAFKPQNFKSAFAEARSAGDKTFEFGGKKYTTDLAKPSVSGKRETTVEDVFPVLTGEKKRAEEKMDKKQFRAEQNAQIIAREAAKAKARAKEAKDKETITPRRSGMSGVTKIDPEDFKKQPKGMGTLTFAKGGSVSSRADGIAQRGKTRCKVC